MPEHFAGISHSAERAERDIRAIGDKAESRKEPGKKRGGTFCERRIPQISNGARMPIIGPAQTTNSGCGLSAKSVREMASGLITTLATRPPLTQAPKT